MGKVNVRSPSDRSDSLTITKTQWWLQNWYVQVGPALCVMCVTKAAKNRIIKCHPGRYYYGRKKDVRATDHLRLPPLCMSRKGEEKSSFLSERFVPMGECAWSKKGKTLSAFVVGSEKIPFSSLAYIV